MVGGIRASGKIISSAIAKNRAKKFFDEASYEE